MKRIAIRTWLCVSFVVVALPTSGGGVLDARVYPPFAFAPCTVRVQAFIEPDARNRSIEFVLDSEAMYTSSTAELDGDRAPRTKEVMFRNLPAGTYLIRVTLIGEGGKRVATTRRVDVMPGAQKP